MLRGLLNNVPLSVIMIVTVVVTFVVVLLAVCAYQNFLDADANVSREADALASITRDSAAFPEPGGGNVRRAVGTYVRSVVNDEWPKLHNTGDYSLLTARRLDNVFAAFRTVKPTTPVETSFYDDAVGQLNDALDARRNRIQTVGGGLPRDIATLILFSSFVIIAYAVLVGSPNFWFHVLGPAAIALVVAISLVVLVDLTYPFSGDVAITPEDFRTGALLQYFGGA